VTFALLLAGVVLLTMGAEVLVRGATALALAVRISPLVVGLTVVAFGTSAPEMVVSVQSAMMGEPEIALGNVIGSNIFNVLFILGLAACITPLVVAQQLVRFDVPLMIAISLLTLALGLDGSLGRVDGALLFTGLLAYTGWAIRASRREQAAIAAEYEEGVGKPEDPSFGRVILQCALVILGLLLLVGGARLFLDASVEIARSLGVSELVIGITIVAVGTSLPEVATSLVAAIRGERDIAVGNAVGSNLFNLLGVLGLAGLVADGGVSIPPDAMWVDLPVMIAVAVACLPVFFTGHVIARWEGAVFLAYYVAYTAYLVLAVANPAFGRTLGVAMMTIVLPLTGLTFAVAVYRSLNQGRSEVGAAAGSGEG
jgi:cation:H+ antiporter